MKFTIKRLMAGTLALGLLALSGCAATPDSKEDPLSQFGVDAQLPFATKPVTETATPAPMVSATPVAAPTNTLSWQDEELEDPGDIEAVSYTHLQCCSAFRCAICTPRWKP